MRPLGIVAQREKEVRQVRKELIKLDKAKRNLAKIPLDKPVRYGWYKALKLRSDVTRRKDAAVFEEILEVCGRYVWGKTKQRADKEWEHMLRSRRRTWQWAGFSRVSKNRWKELSPAAQKYFTQYEWRWNPWQGSIKKYYCHVPKSYFVTTYEKAYVTHLQAVDADLDSQIAQLENQLTADEYYAFYWGERKRWLNKYMRKWDVRKTRRRAKQALIHYDEEQFDLRMGKAYRN